MSVVAAILPILSPLVGLWIKMFITGDANKQQARDLWMKFIDLHKNDGVQAASEHASFDQQVQDIKDKDAAPPSA